MRVNTIEEFAKTIRETRKNNKLTQAELAAATGVGERFIRELEKGKPTCQLEKAFLVAQMLGIKLELILPPNESDDEH